MAHTTDSQPAQGQHIDIPKISSISGRTAVHNDSMSRALWTRGGSLVTFLMALALPVLPIVLLIKLIAQPGTGPSGLTWVWITMLVVTGAISFLAAFGIVRSVLEAGA